MSKHVLNIDDLANFESRIQIAGSFGNGNNKSLEIVSKITIRDQIFSCFVVSDHNIARLTTTNLSKAITEYNTY